MEDQRYLQGRFAVWSCCARVKSVIDDGLRFPSLYLLQPPKQNSKSLARSGCFELLSTCQERDESLQC